MVIQGHCRKVGPRTESGLQAIRANLHLAPPERGEGLAFRDGLRREWADV